MQEKKQVLPLGITDCHAGTSLAFVILKRNCNVTASKDILYNHVHPFVAIVWERLTFRCDNQL